MKSITLGNSMTRGFVVLTCGVVLAMQVAASPPVSKQAEPTGSITSVLAGESRKAIEVQANTFTKSTQENTAVDVTPTGEMIAVWDSRRQERGSYGVYAQRFDALGRPIGPEVHLNNYLRGMQRRPVVACGPNGETWFAWESFGQDGSSGSIVARRYESGLEQPTDEIPVNEMRLGLQFDPVLAVNSQGVVCVVWSSDQQTDGSAQPQVRGRLYDQNGQAIAGEFAITPDRSGRDEKPCVVVGSDDRFFIVWARTDSDGTPVGIVGRFVESDGSGLGDELALSDGSPAEVVHQQDIDPTVAVDAVGRFVVVWMTVVDDGYAVNMRRFAADGQPLGAVRTIAGPSDGWKSGVAVACAGDGRFIVTYNTDVPGGDGTSRSNAIFSQMFDSHGALIDGPRRFDTGQSGSQQLTIASGAQRLVWKGQDQIVAAWNGDSGHGDSSAANLTAWVPDDLDVPAPVEQGERLAALVSSQDFLEPIPPMWDPDWVPQEPLIFPAGDGPDFGFEGVPGTGWTPPDPELAVGPEHIVVMTNGQIAAFLKDGTNVFRDEIENTFGFWGDQGADNFVFDPECCWDPHSQRFWAMACERSDNGRSMFLLAVSKDDQPDNSDDWWKWRFDVTSISDNDIDSPNMGVDIEAVYLTADFFGPDKYLIYMLEKAPMLSGSLGVITHDLITGSSQQSMGIPVTYDATAPAQYIIQSTEYSSNNTVIFHAMKEPFGSYTRQTVTVSVEPYTYPNQPPQKGSTSRPYLFEPRFWSCVQRNDAIWATHHVNSSRARQRWYEFDMRGWPDSGQDPIVHQWGEIDLGGDIHTFFGSINVDGEGNAAMTYARSSPDEYISMSRAVRAWSDPLGTFQDSVFVKESTAAHTSGRWGDYSFTQPDPVADPGTFWGHHEFCTGSGWSWRTWIAQYVVVPVMTLDVEPLYAGQLATMTVTNASPTTMVYFIYSLQGEGSTYVPQLDVTLDLDQPKLAGSSVSDANGTAVYQQMLPPNSQNTAVWIQAAEYGVTSNLVLTQVN